MWQPCHLRMLWALGSLHQNVSGEQLRSSNLHSDFFCPGDWDAQMFTESTWCLEFLSLSQAVPQPVNRLSETVLTSPSQHTVSLLWPPFPELHRFSWLIVVDDYVRNQLWARWLYTDCTSWATGVSLGGHSTKLGMVSDVFWSCWAGFWWEAWSCWWLFF